MRTLFGRSDRRSGITSRACVNTGSQCRNRRVRRPLSTWLRPPNDRPALLSRNAGDITLPAFELTLLGVRRPSNLKSCTNPVPAIRRRPEFGCHTIFLPRWIGALTDGAPICVSNILHCSEMLAARHSISRQYFFSAPGHAIVANITVWREVIDPALRETAWRHVSLPRSLLHRGHGNVVLPRIRCVNAREKTALFQLVTVLSNTAGAGPVVSVRSAGDDFCQSLSLRFQSLRSGCTHMSFLARAHSLYLS